MLPNRSAFFYNLATVLFIARINPCFNASVLWVTCFQQTKKEKQLFSRCWPRRGQKFNNFADLFGSHYLAFRVNMYSVCFLTCLFEVCLHPFWCCKTSPGSKFFPVPGNPGPWAYGLKFLVHEIRFLPGGVLGSPGQGVAGTRRLRVPAGLRVPARGCGYPRGLR